VKTIPLPNVRTHGYYKSEPELVDNPLGMKMSLHSMLFGNMTYLALAVRQHRSEKVTHEAIPYCHAVLICFLAINFNLKHSYQCAENHSEY
jgi:hypothetical protein